MGNVTRSGTLPHSAVPYEQAHERGHIAEQKVAAWLISRGWVIFPVCDGDVEHHPPLVYADGWQGIVPDFLCFRDGVKAWAEVKSKSRFTWHYISQQWQTGIDEAQRDHYRELCEKTGMPLYLFFFHHGNKANDKQVKNGAPAECPTGLFCGEFAKLDACVASYSQSRAAHGEQRFSGAAPGMVYWNCSDLRCLATVEEVEHAAAELLTDQPFFNVRTQPHERNQPGSAL